MKLNIFSRAYWPSVSSLKYLLCSSPLPIFELSYFFVDGGNLGSSLEMLAINPLQIYDLQIFLLFCGLSFHSLVNVL